MRLLPFALLIVLYGCVSASRLKEQEAATGSQTKRAEQAEAALKTAEKNAAELKQQLKTSSEQIEAGNKTISDLQQTLEANKNSLVKKASDLIKERDIIAQKLAERETEAARLAEELKAAEAAKAAEIASVKKSYEDLAGSLKSEIAAGEVKITELKGKLTVNMIDRILFDSGQAEVKSNGRTVLAKVGAILKGVSGKDIRIEGHTDNVPIGGELKTRYATNWELSTARATAVARYLQDVASIEPTRLGATGYGEFRPIAPNDTPENRALNRRIEIVLVAKD